ncbi:MAG: hypothetical protein NZ481_05530 [Candidatus Kapabacteria bacterium]|nr:hypothetical protein [Candidatus Kapabacteria bacterium]
MNYLSTERTKGIPGVFHLTLSFSIALLISVQLFAQGPVSVSVQLSFAGQMPARISEWRENEALIRFVVRNTGHVDFADLICSIELLREGRRIAWTRNGHPAQPRFRLNRGDIRMLSWREVINEQAVEYDQQMRDNITRTGELPEGSYELCMTVLDGQMRPLSQRACAQFTITLPDPPQLLSPIGGSTVNAMPLVQVDSPPILELYDWRYIAPFSPARLIGGSTVNVTPLLQWAPARPAPAGIVYRVTLKVRYRGQTPAHAMMTNPVRLQVDVPTTSYQIPVQEQLGPDAADPNYAGHVWQVQALLNGRPYGRNNGASQIEWFTLADTSAQTDAAQRFRIDGLEEPCSRPLPIAVFEWDVDMTDLWKGGVELEYPPMSEDVTDTILNLVRVRIPQQLNSEIIEELLANADAIVLDDSLFTEGQGGANQTARLRGSGPIRGNITLLKRTAGPQGAVGNSDQSVKGDITRLKGSGPIRGNITLLKRTAGPQGQGDSGQGDSAEVARLKSSGPIRGNITLLKRTAGPEGQGSGGQGNNTYVRLRMIEGIDSEDVIEVDVINKGGMDNKGGTLWRLKGSGPIRGNITLLKRTAGPEGQGGNPPSSEEATHYLCYAVADDSSSTTVRVESFDTDGLYFHVYFSEFVAGSAPPNSGTNPMENSEGTVTDTLVFSPTHILIPIPSVYGIVQERSVVLYLGGAENRAQRAVNEGKFAAEIAPLENEVARKLSADGRHVAWIVDSPFTSTNYGNLNGFAEAWISANATTRVAGSNTQTDNVLVYVFATPKPAVHR